MDPKSVKAGALIELRDEETQSWLPLTIVSVSPASGDVECRMLGDEPIFTTTSALIVGARLRPRRTTRRRRIRKRESHKRELRQLFDLYEVGVCLPMTRDELIDAILRVNERFNHNPSIDEALNSGDGTYKP